MSHLDARTWSALQQAPDAALLAHVAEGCEQCDAFLATVAGLEGAVDVSLLHAAAVRERRDGELAWARYRRAARRPSRRVLVAAAAGLALVAVGSALAWRSPAPTGLKGDGPATIELRAAARVANGEVVALAPGATVGAEATLVFRVESNVAGHGVLLVQRGGGAPEFLARVRLDGGMQELERADGLLGLSLSGERGPLVVWVVASEDELAVDRAVRAVRDGGDRSIAVGKLRVDVTP